jgi:hypothetical protein
MASRPSTISIKDLSNAVEHAVKIATQKHNVRFSPEFRIEPGTIIGRQLLQADIGLKQAEQIATEITQHVMTSGAAAIAGTQLEPVVFVRRGGTTCGAICPTSFELS